MCELFDSTSSCNPYRYFKGGSQGVSDKVDLIENEEYGYCSLIKATKSVLTKLEIENKTAARITPMERVETPLWDRVAVREAVINAIVHNDYSFEVPPKFEIFPDRLEITSAGRLPESLSREEFFTGISIPRNKELMRIYRDLDIVESLGSGIPRILRAYGENCFRFTDNFIRITFPASVQIDHVSATENATENATEKTNKTQQGILHLIKENKYLTYDEITKQLSLERTTVWRNIKKLQEKGLLRRVGPDKGGYWEVIDNDVNK